jgi:hypothetical protein
VDVSNYNPPVITGVTYDGATGQLTLNGTNFVSKSGASNDIDLSKLSIGGYALSDSGGVEITSATSAVITLSTTDRMAINGLLNKDGTSDQAGTPYNLAAAEDWMTGVAASVDIADLTGNSITVSNYTVPTITSATYDLNTKTLVVTGTNFVTKSGAANDVDVSDLTLTGKGGTYMLTSTGDVDVTSETSFSIVLDATDAAGVAALLDANGTSASDGTVYNLAATGNWLAQLPDPTVVGGATVIDDATGNGIEVANVPDTSSNLNVSQIEGEDDPQEQEQQGNNGEGDNAEGSNESGSVNTPIAEVNFGPTGDGTTWGGVVENGGSSSSVIDDPSAGVEGMTIVRNAVTGNDAALNSFYGSGRVSGGSDGGRTTGAQGGSGIGNSVGSNPGLSGLAGSGGDLNGMANGFANGVGIGEGIGNVDGAGIDGNSVSDDANGEEEPVVGDQAKVAPFKGRMTFSTQLAEASGVEDLKVVKALLKAV